MSIDRITGNIPQIPSIQTPKVAEGGKDGVQNGAKEVSFGEMFSRAIENVNELQVQADKSIEGVVSGKPGYTPHDAMIALEQADIAFQLMSTIKSKIIRAYEDLMRTQV